MRVKIAAGCSATALLVLLCYGILTLWVPERWAAGVYQAGAFLLAGVWTIRLAICPSRARLSPALALVAGVAALGLVQLAGRITIDRWETWNSVLQWTAHAAVLFVALQSLADAAARHRFLDRLLYFGFALSVVSTVQMFTSGGKIFWLFPSGYRDLVLGPFVYRNQYAAFIEMVLPLALYRSLQNAGTRSFGYWAMAAVMVASVLAGASRAGSLLVLLEIVAVLLLAHRRKLISARTAALALLRFALVLAAATAVVGWGSVWQRFHLADPYVLRREMLQSSTQMIRERPWTGFGLGTWPAAYPRFALYDDGFVVNQAHDDWVQWTVEGGLPLLALMLLFTVLLVRPALRSLWGLGLLAVLIHSLVDYPLQQRPALAGWFFALAGALLAQASVPEPANLGRAANASS